MERNAAKVDKSGKQRSAGNHPSATVRSRLRRVLGGVTLAAGFALLVLSIQAAAMGLSGYGDVFSFMGSLGLAAIMVATGWELVA